jgi:hypothetical protein
VCYYNRTEFTILPIDQLIAIEGKRRIMLV